MYLNLLFWDEKIYKCGFIAHTFYVIIFIGDTVKNKIISNIITYLFIVFLIVLLVDCIIKKYIFASVIILIDIIIFLPLTKKVLLKIFGKNKDLIIYISRILFTIFIFISISLSRRMSFYHTYISEDKNTTVIIEKKKIIIKEKNKKEEYKYNYSMGENRKEFFIEVLPNKTMEHQFLLFRYNEDLDELCKLEDGSCIENYIVKK